MDSAAAAEIRLGRALGLDVSLMPSALWGLPVAGAGFAAVGLVLFHVSLVTALLGGVALTLLHMVSEFMHNVGHATAARSIGYPMTGVRYWGPLATSVYPEGEPELAPRLHVRRALGGPAGSAVLTLVLAAVALVVISAVPGLGWISLLWFLDNLLVFTLGAFLPLGFTDGSTLLRWWGKR